MRLRTDCHLEAALCGPYQPSPTSWIKGIIYESMQADGCGSIQLRRIVGTALLVVIKKLERQWLLSSLRKGPTELFVDAVVRAQKYSVDLSFALEYMELLKYMTPAFPLMNYELYPESALNPTQFGNLTQVQWSDFQECIWRPVDFLWKDTPQKFCFNFTN